MGVYLNPGDIMFQRARNSKIYVDMSGMISILNGWLKSEQEYVCVSRPRRFGKSMTANMICAYYDRTMDGSIFEGLEISTIAHGMDEQGKYDVLRINMQDFLSRSSSMEELLTVLQKRITRDLTKAYPDTDYFDTDNLPDVMEEIFAETGILFVIVIDEWDCVFREFPGDSGAQKKYLDFLRTWLKDRPYIALAYMTGILPIKKYGTHSALNMFFEYSMENPGILAKYTGFTENEVRALCEEYSISFDDCANWYDGYYFPQCGHVYNPRSIVSVMMSGIFDDYWNRTETYEALRVYIDMNMDGLRDDIVRMMAGDRVKIDTGGFQNDMTTFNSKDDVMTLLVHLGYLGYEFDTRSAFIPNREIQTEFVTATKASRWNEVLRSVVASDNLLTATWARDAEAVAEGIERAHLETSHLQYNDENALSYTVSLAYYAARQYYTLVREFPTGKGFADVAFIPRKKYAAEKPAMLVELKWDKSADSAIRQIHTKQYDGALKDYQGNLLLVGISYNKKTRKHECRIE